MFEELTTEVKVSKTETHFELSYSMKGTKINKLQRRKGELFNIHSILVTIGEAEVLPFDNYLISKELLDLDNHVGTKRAFSCRKNKYSTPFDYKQFYNRGRIPEQWFRWSDAC